MQFLQEMVTPRKYVGLHVITRLAICCWWVKVKVNGATLAFISLSGSTEPVGMHGVCDAWPVRRQTYGYLPNQSTITTPSPVGAHFPSR